MKIPDPAIAAEGSRKFSRPDIAMAVPNTLQEGVRLEGHRRRNRGREAEGAAASPTLRAGGGQL